MPLPDWISSDFAYSEQGLCFSHLRSPIRSRMAQRSHLWFVASKKCKKSWIFVHFSFLSFLEQLHLLVQRLRFQSNETPNWFPSRLRSPSQRWLTLEQGLELSIQSRTTTQEIWFVCVVSQLEKATKCSGVSSLRSWMWCVSRVAFQNWPAVSPSSTWSPRWRLMCVFPSDGCAEQGWLSVYIVVVTTTMVSK